LKSYKNSKFKRHVISRQRYQKVKEPGAATFNSKVRQQPGGPTDGKCRRSTSLDRATRPRLHAARQNCVCGIRPERLTRNRPVHRFLKKPAGSTGFYRFDCTSGLLSEPDRFMLWFGLLAVEPPVRFGPNNCGDTQTNRTTH
jgi:hypothetical protein